MKVYFKLSYNHSVPRVGDGTGGRLALALDFANDYPVSDVKGTMVVEFKVDRFNLKEFREGEKLGIVPCKASAYSKWIAEKIKNRKCESF